MAFLRLYEQVDDSEDLEFSLGILSRSIMMDMILMMGIQKISIEYNESNYNEVVQKIKQYCEMIIADGTMYLINEVKDSESFSDDEKKEISINLASYFPNIINVSKNVPKLNKEFRFKHSEIYNQSKVVNIENNKSSEAVKEKKSSSSSPSRGSSTRAGLATTSRRTSICRPARGRSPAC